MKTKEQGLPQIPQQNIPQAHSMYQQLSKVSHKQFQSTHRRIFNNLNTTYRSNHTHHQQTTSRISHFELPFSGNQQKLLQFMREQIQIGSQQWWNKAKCVLLQQTNKINQLSALLRKNYRQIEDKNNKIKELEQILNKKESFCQVWMNKIATLQTKFKQKYSILSKQYATKLKNIAQNTQQRIQQLQKRQELCKHQTKSISARQNHRLEQKIDSLEHFLSQIRAEMQCFQTKQFNYEHFQLTQLKAKIYDIQRNLTTIENNSYKMTNTCTKISRVSSQMIKTTPLFQRAWSNPSLSDSSNSQNDQKMDNIQRFMDILDQLGTSLPLYIEVDQTGYAKSKQTGMYLVDRIGDGFEFSSQQLFLLKKRNIIKM